jgi:hypothetical protein
MRRFFRNRKNLIFLAFACAVLLLSVVVGIALRLQMSSSTLNSVNTKSSVSYPISYLSSVIDDIDYPFSGINEVPNLVQPATPINNIVVKPQDSSTTIFEADFLPGLQKDREVLPVGMSATDRSLTYISTRVHADATLYANCTMSAFKNNSLFQKVDFQMYNIEWGYPTMYLPIGVYNIEVKCITLGGKEYSKKSMIAEVREDVSPKCDKYEFKAEGDSELLADAQNNIVGKWRGCVSTPWSKPYEVEFIFYKDGKYEARNYELVTNPETFRRDAALYYGSDKNSDLNTYSLKASENGKAEAGVINIYFGSASQVVDKLQNIKFNTDNSKLYFEFIHIIGNTNYGPLKYVLEKVN